MAAVVSVSVDQALELSRGMEPFAVANTKPAATLALAQTAPKAHTLSARLFAPNVIVVKPMSSRPWPAATATARQLAGASTSIEQQKVVPVENVVRLPDPTPLDYWFDVRQQWEGVVTSVNGDEFSVVLRDVSRANAPVTVHAPERVVERDQGASSEGTLCPSMWARQASVM